LFWENKSEAMINLSYRDPAPETVCQAVNCRLPVIFAFSGGTNEIVAKGISIFDSLEIKFESETPSLDIVSMHKAWSAFKFFKNNLINEINYDKNNFMSMVSSYFSGF
jgi:hypothetical protein